MPRFLPIRETVMLSSVYSAGLEGVDGYIVAVECNMSPRLAAFEIVGLPDAAVKEAKERIRAAICNSGYEFPDAEITINLAPADKKKQGSAYDLALLAGVLACSGDLPDKLEGMCFIGELSLSGEVRPVRGVLSMCDAARAAGLTEIFVPARNAAEASVIQGVTVYPVPDVVSLVKHLNGERPLVPAAFDKSSFFGGVVRHQFDFADVKGQEFEARAKNCSGRRAQCAYDWAAWTGKSACHGTNFCRFCRTLRPKRLSKPPRYTRLRAFAGECVANCAAAFSPCLATRHDVALYRAYGGRTIYRAPGEVRLRITELLFLDELPGVRCKTVEREEACASRA